MRMSTIEKCRAALKLIEKGATHAAACEATGTKKSSLFDYRRSIGLCKPRSAHSPKLLLADLGEGEDARDIVRCRCGLMLPCNACLPSVDDFAMRGWGQWES